MTRSTPPGTSPACSSATSCSASSRRTNPSGAGLALEFGAAAALGKHIVYVQEAGFPLSRYFGMARSVSDTVHDCLDNGIECLAALCGFKPGTGEDFKRSYVLQGSRPVLCERLV